MSILCCSYCGENQNVDLAGPAGGMWCGECRTLAVQGREEPVAPPKEPEKVCPRCLRPHDFDLNWDDTLWAMWCDADRRLSIIESQLRGVGVLQKGATRTGAKR